MLTGRLLKNAKVWGNVDLPKSEHHGGSFKRTLSTIGVSLLISVLSFRSWSSFSPPTASVDREDFLCQKSVRTNFVGAFLPPENWIMCHPSTLLLLPTGTISSKLLASKDWKLWRRERIREDKMMVKNTKLHQRGLKLTKTSEDANSRMWQKKNHNHVTKCYLTMFPLSNCICNVIIKSIDHVNSWLA